VVEAIQLSVGGSNDERRGRCATTVEKTLLGVWNQQTDEHEGEDIEEGNTPEDLLDSTGQLLSWVGRLSSGKTDELSTRERESSRDESCTNTLEAAGKGTRVVPQASAVVFVIWSARLTTAKDKHERNDHEDDNGGQLKAGRPEFFFTVAENAKDIDNDQSDEEDCAIC
jgi:hypothetical protein